MPLTEVIPLIKFALLVVEHAKTIRFKLDIHSSDNICPGYLVKLSFIF